MAPTKTVKSNFLKGLNGAQEASTKIALTVAQ